jgi:polyhydroxybutyrate depolymerase
VRPVKSLAQALFLAAFVVLGGCRGCRRTETAAEAHEISVAGRTRSYVLHLPAGHDGKTKLPLVIALHGGGGNADNMARMSGLSEKADQEGFAVVYPNGTGPLDGRLLTWNAGNCCGQAFGEDVDDVAFIRTLLDSVEKEHPIDTHRVFATGMSNGGMMSYRLACELGDRIVAIAPVAGALNVPSCKPSRPVSLLIVHGTADRHVRYEGGEPEEKADPRPRVDASVADATKRFVARNGCDASAAKSRRGVVRDETYAGCADGTAVRVVSIEGGGHAWPGGQKGTPWGDEPAAAVSATDLLWDFFASHPRP